MAASAIFGLSYWGGQTVREYLTGLSLLLSVYLMAAKRRPTYGTMAPGMAQTFSALTAYLALVCAIASLSFQTGMASYALFAAVCFFLTMSVSHAPVSDFTVQVPRRMMWWGVGSCIFVGAYLWLIVLVVR